MDNFVFSLTCAFVQYSKMADLDASFDNVRVCAAVARVSTYFFDLRKFALFALFNIRNEFELIHPLNLKHQVVR